MEQVQGHPDDLGLELPDAWEGVRIEWVRVGSQSVGLSDGIDLLHVGLLVTHAGKRAIFSLEFAYME